MTESRITRQARMRIAQQPYTIKEFKPTRTVWQGVEGEYVNKPFTKHQLAMAADTLDALADYWTANPHRWIKGTALSAGGGGRMCNVGVLGVSLGSYDHQDYAVKMGFKPSEMTTTFKASVSKRAITFTEAHVNFLVEINDKAQTLDENIAGLRYAAQAYRYHAEGMKWGEAVDKAWSQNTKLLKVQIQRWGKISPQGAKWATRKLKTLIGAA